MFARLVFSTRFVVRSHTVSISPRAAVPHRLLSFTKVKGDKKDSQKDGDRWRRWEKENKEKEEDEEKKMRKEKEKGKTEEEKRRKRNDENIKDIKKYFVKTLTSLPKPVARELRKGIPFPMRPDSSDDFATHSRTAMKIYDEIGTDPLSDDGIKGWVDMAEKMENELGGNRENATTALESILERIASKAGVTNDGAERARLLKWAVKAWNRLGNLYKQAGKDSKAEGALRQVVDTVLQENNSAVVGSDWLKASEMVKAMEYLGKRSDGTGQHQKAIDDYSLALEYAPKDSYMRVALLHYIAVLKSKMSTASPGDAKQRELQNAITAQQEAIQAAETMLDKDVQPELECEKLLAQGMCNLAELTQMTGNEQLARQRFKNAKRKIMVLDGMKGLKDYRGELEAEQVRASSGLKSVPLEQRRNDVKQMINGGFPA